jgi:hypothetical protein
MKEWRPRITSISCRVTRGEAQALCPREKPFLSRSGTVGTWTGHKSIGREEPKNAADTEKIGSRTFDVTYIDVDGNAALSYSAGGCQRSADKGDSSGTEQEGIHTRTRPAYMSQEPGKLIWYIKEIAN